MADHVVVATEIAADPVRAVEKASCLRDQIIALLVSLTTLVLLYLIGFPQFLEAITSALPAMLVDLLAGQSTRRATLDTHLPVVRPRTSSPSANRFRAVPPEEIAVADVAAASSAASKEVPMLLPSSAVNGCC